MAETRDAEIVVTGVGVICPFGVGLQALHEGIDSGRSGIGPIQSFDSSQLPVHIAGQITGFDPRNHVRPRKSIKMMSRSIQLGVAAASMACEDAGMVAGTVAPDRLGAVLGADMMRHEMNEIEPLYRVSVVDGMLDLSLLPAEGFRQANPLSLLKILPNMLSSHISIAQDARGPNNTITMREISSLLSVIEAADIIRRGAADMMIAGGASSRLHPLDFVRHCVMAEMSTRPAGDAPRPFDADRDGQVLGEGAGAVILETAAHARARGARVHARLVGWSSASEPHRDGQVPQGLAIERAVREAMQQAQLATAKIGHVNAHGLGTVADDLIEARALGKVLPDTLVTAPKSYFGNLNAASGAVELAVSLRALQSGWIPPTRNHQRTDPACPLPIVHPSATASPAPGCVCVNHILRGHVAAAIVLSRG